MRTWFSPRYRIPEATLLACDIKKCFGQRRSFSASGLEPDYSNRRKKKITSVSNATFLFLETDFKNLWVNWLESSNSLVPAYAMTSECHWKEVLSTTGPGKTLDHGITHWGGGMPVSTGTARGSAASAPHLGLSPETPGIRESARRVWNIIWRSLVIIQLCPFHYVPSVLKGSFFFLLLEKLENCVSSCHKGVQGKLVY